MAARTARIGDDRVRPLWRAEYDRLVDLGVFEGEKLELLNGRLVCMSPIGEDHVYCVTQLTKLLIRALGDRAEVRVQAPLAATDDSEPEPDIAVVPPGDYRDGHPRTALLIIEVAQSSLDDDREVKAPLYAAAGVPEYWIVNLVERVVEVRTEPRPDGYASTVRHERDARLAVPGFADVVLAVSDFVPAP